MTTHTVSIRGNRIDLGVLHKDYLDQMIDIMNDVRVAQYLLVRPPLSRKKEEEFLERVDSSETGHIFAILKKTEAGEHEYIGHTDVHILNHRHGVGITGSIIKFDEVSKGYGTEAKHLMLFFAFRFLGLHKIRSSVLSHNGRSLRFLEKTGHKVVGTHRNEFFRGGVLCDEIIVEVTPEEWLPTWEEYKKKYSMEDPF